MLREKCIAVKAYIKIKKDQINYLTLCNRELKREETKFKTGRRKGNSNDYSRNKWKNRKTIRLIKTKVGPLKKIKKIDNF